MKKKVFLTRTLHDFALKELREKYQIEIHTGKIPIPQTKLRSKIKDIDGLSVFHMISLVKRLLKKEKISKQSVRIV